MLTRELYDAYAAAIGIVDACVEAMLRLVEEAGQSVACRRGCNTCCDCLIPATLAEAMPIANWLSSPERKQRLDQFWDAIRRRRDSLGPDVHVLETLSRSSEGADLNQFRVAASAYRRRRFLCLFNAGDGSCEIYPIRPLTCRAYYVADTAEFCRHDALRGPTVVRHRALQEAVELADGILSGASSLAASPGIKALPEAVASALSWIEHENLKKGDEQWRL